MLFAGSGRRTSPPVRVLDAVASRELEAVTSPALADEYRRVFSTDVARRYLRRSQIELARVVDEFLAVSQSRTPRRAEIAAPDPRDQHLWDLLFAVPDAILVTGEKRLRENPPPGREVLSPREFVERYLAEPAT